MKALIGVMPEELIRKRILAIAKGEYQPQEREPKVWFTSMIALAQVLSNENIALLRLIDTARPETISQLAELSGRQVSNPVNHAENAERARPGGTGKTGALGKAPSAVYRFRNYRGSEVKCPL